MIEYELVNRCRSGERSAQHEIYTLTVERVYRLILRITRNHDDAFDLVQEAYIQAFTQINQFDGRSSFETWLTRIAINQTLQNQRRMSLRERTTASMNGRYTPPAFLPPHDQKIDVDDALAQLPEADRAMLVLRYQEGLDYAAIAGLTGCPPGTVASRLNRARERVRKLLKKSYASPEETPRAVHPISRSNRGSAQPAAEVPAPRLQRGAEP
jgi:RNA polymerase sigma-70 factor (ECF subfamily)